MYYVLFIFILHNKLTKKSMGLEEVGEKLCNFTIASIQVNHLHKILVFYKLIYNIFIGQRLRQTALKPGLAKTRLNLPFYIPVYSPHVLQPLFLLVNLVPNIIKLIAPAYEFDCLQSIIYFVGHPWFSGFCSNILNIN